MLGLIISILVVSLLASFYQLKLNLYSLAIIGLEILFISTQLISNLEFYLLLIPTVSIIALINVKQLRKKILTGPLAKYFINSNNQWDNFQRIDNGWFASDLEKSIFRGKPHFIAYENEETNSNNHLVNQQIFAILENQRSKSSNISTINKMAKIGATSLLLNYGSKTTKLSYLDISNILKNISQVSPVLAAIVGLLNLDSLTSIIHHFSSKRQKEKYLPLISDAKMIPFIKPTSLYETLDSQKSSIEGRIEKEIIKNKVVMGVKISFQDVILLGTTSSNCFYLNVNIKDFNNLYGTKTHLGTAICILNNEIKGLKYKKGLKAYDDYLYYYACTGKNIFIPFSHIINEKEGFGKGLEYLYKNQYIASSIWPLSVSIPINNTATLTAWYFAHLQKQNGRQLLSFKVVQAKLNEQFGQCLKLQLMNQLSLKNDLNPQMLKFTAILNKETHINQTMEQLGLLRGILGSNAHNIKTESKVRSFYKVAHLSTELDGMNHEINQLPLIKKAALACHPYYHQEVDLLVLTNDFDLTKFDKIIFQHIGYILHNLTRTWVYTLRTSFIGRLLFPKNKYQMMIKRMSSSFAFLSDITLINWTFKVKINTSFASHLGECVQDIATSIALHQYYLSDASTDHTKDLTKTTLKNTLHTIQNSLKDTVNLAFNRWAGVLMKILIFPTGRPFHKISIHQSLTNDIEKICGINEASADSYNNYSPFLKKIHLAKQKLKDAEAAEIAVTNVTGTPVTTGNYETLIDRCLAAGIVSIEQSEQLRDAYQSILEIQLTNHFGVNANQKN